MKAYQYLKSNDIDVTTFKNPNFLVIVLGFNRRIRGLKETRNSEDLL